MRVGFGLGLVFAAVAQLGCEEPIPAEPHFEADILPVFQAHCVRCHGAGDMLNTDPKLAAVLGRPMHAYPNEFDDATTGCPPAGAPPEPASATCHQGAGSVAGSIGVLIHAKGLGRMPP